MKSKLIVVLLVLVTTIIFVACGKANQSEETNQIPKDIASFSSQETYEYLTSNDISFGYSYSPSSNTEFCIVQEYSNGNFITYQYCSQPLLGGWYTFGDDSVNDETVKFGSDQVETHETLEQADAYQRWLNKYGISEAQLNDAIDYYCSVTEPEELTY